MRANLILILVISAHADSARAGLVFSDDFSSVGGGVGWQASSSWDGVASISGGTISHSGESFRTMNTGITIGTADFWFATRVRLSGTFTKWGAISFYDSTDEDVYFGTDTASTVWEFGNASVFSDQESTVSSFNQVNEAYLLAHITSSTIDVWGNPSDTSSEAALGGADATVTIDPIDPFATWSRLGIRSNAAVTITVNSLAAATTLSEAVNATAVPEPSVFVFWGCAALAGIAYRWKRIFA